MRQLLVLALILAPFLVFPHKVHSQGAVASSSVPSSSGGGSGAVGGAVSSDLTLADNVKIIFGTGSDTEVYFDATDLVLAAQAGSVSFPGLAGTANEVIGSGAGAALTAGATNNVILGNGAGAALTGTTGGDDSVIIGSAAGALQTTASFNVLIGRQAGDAITTGGANTAIGYQAGSTISTNAGLVAVGSGACDGESSARMTCVGQSTAVFSNDGTAIGNAAESSDGVSVGYQAGDAQAAADVDNTFIGNNAGGAATGTSTDNTCVGDTACDALTTGDQNTLVGADTDVGTATDSNTTAVGFGMVGKNSSSMLLGFGGQEQYFAQGTAKALTESSATAVVQISVAQGAYTGGVIHWTVVADDTTDYQALAGSTTFQAVNPAGTEVCTVETTGGASEAVSTGTLTNTVTCTTGLTDVVQIAFNAASSLTQTSLNAYYSVILNGPGTITPQ